MELAGGAGRAEAEALPITSCETAGTWPDAQNRGVLSQRNGDDKTDLAGSVRVFLLVTQLDRCPD